MERIPRNILETLEDLYKRYSASPRDFPGVHIHWQGCGDSGGIEEITFLTREGVDYVKYHGSAPPSFMYDKPVNYYYTKETPGHDGITRNRVVSADEGNDYTLGQFVYERFNICEVNEGGYAHVFIEMPQGKMWGESWDYVQTEQSNTCMYHED